MKENLKGKNGITLIALVITIIVLLILAGVTIAMLTGENGILTQAKNAKTGTENKNAEEKVKLAIMAARAQSQDASLDLEKLETEVTTNYGGQVDGTEFPVTVTIDEKSFTVDGDGNASKTINWNKILEEANENPESMKHPEQVVSDYIGIGTDGEPVNMDLWRPSLRSDGSWALMSVTTSYGRKTSVYRSDR